MKYILYNLRNFGKEIIALKSIEKLELRDEKLSCVNATYKVYGLPYFQPHLID